ncbi:MAG: hypothetical protein AAGA58_02615 [Verrucomicrobiota bacterium]
MANRLDPAALEEHFPDKNENVESLDELAASIIELDPKLTDLLVAIADRKEPRSKLIARLQAWNEQMGGDEIESLEPVALVEEGTPNWLG